MKYAFYMYIIYTKCVFISYIFIDDYNIYHIYIYFSKIHVHYIQNKVKLLLNFEHIRTLNAF